ncbi:DUF262 domain-containing HNH endonuclease family protein [Pantoea brenneri]|uniref:DUF262 domain-containing protein n=1 Tax=Pantoea brenneri TaxID=472694 RepID=UPI0024484250|nr:DUF262 domain-containing protein [Pantoea brenneri]MDH1088705.1 DUF262 domain-containing HNH endonuclease family protein [Pantoea brenneri]
MPSKSIKAIVQEINNDDADGGGLWLPNIQRQFVWHTNQIARLFDSVMRQYPLSSMLFWKTREVIKHRKFIQNFNGGKVDLKDHYHHGKPKAKWLVLDGQQRLQSFYLALKGSIDGHVLHFNLLSGQPASKEELRYRFEFMDIYTAGWPWMAMSDIIYTKKLPEQILSLRIQKEKLELSAKERELATINLSRARMEFSNESTLLYHVIDSSDDESELTFDDVVEVFIRANSGGTRLSKSDLMFTLLSTEWSEADVIFEDFLEEINDNDRFNFSRDFLIKLSTTILGYGAKYDVDKLRDDEVRRKISENWPEIAKALFFVKDEIVSKTYVRSGKALTSYNALIPLVYLQYHFPGKLEKSKALKQYLIPALLNAVFSGQPDGIIDKLVKLIDEQQGFDVKKIRAAIVSSNRSLHLTEERLFDWCGYGSGHIHLLFNMWYGREYKSSGFQHEPQIDHIFARSILKEQKQLNEESGRQIRTYENWEIDQLANCMLLPAHQNGSGDKGAQPLEQWLRNQPADFFDLHCIPSSPKTLWKVENYRRFIEKRKQLIQKRIAEIGLLEAEE